MYTLPVISYEYHDWVLLNYLFTEYSLIGLGWGGGGGGGEKERDEIIERVVQMDRVGET